MATVTRTIGTAGRDYSTITLWEADLDNGAVYAAGDDAVGECYDDSAFDESVTINGGGTVGLTSVTLTVAVGERHDGTAGTGARIVRSAAFVSDLLALERNSTTAKWLEIDGNGQGASAASLGRQLRALCSFHNIIAHGLRGTSSPTVMLGSANTTAGGTNFVTNSIAYDYSHLSRGQLMGIGFFNASTRAHSFFNNTVHNIAGNHATELVACYQSKSNTANHQFRNCVGTAASNSGAGPDSDFATNALNQLETNASSDATASGTGSLTNIVTADQYVSTVVGSEDLHLKSGSDCIDAGTDLGTTPSGVNIDINGRDRDAEGDVWDIGAHEYVAPSSGGYKDPLFAFGGQ